MRAGDPNQAPEERFASQLDQLASMGFVDRQANIQGGFSFVSLAIGAVRKNLFFLVSSEYGTGNIFKFRNKSFPRDDI